ncbi:Amidohydrolase family [Synechococcus sp. PCC 7335]|uniref:amidohydrolase family protein n=1 Tax=Synechococcus sp. (strain ATCC 29403 / PCC 7335) TaxID=91464 RepID=UPI00017EB0C2|nr:amidohydrolase family protein [Synechococcus sp. PCC 7335]EDX84013.1 Amidohydrolase family [Synechococcus sp. PCC 7335]
MKSAESIQLVRGRWVFSDQGVVTDGAVVVRGENISEIGNWRELRDRYPTALVLGSDHHAVLPGLINAHHHSNGVPNSLAGIEDDLLELWLYSRNAKRSQDSKLRTLLSAAYLLRTGVTSVVDVASIGGSVDASYQEMQSCLSAYEQAGIRVAFTPGAKYDSFLVHGEGQDADFLSTLPLKLQQKVKALTTLSQGLSSGDYLDIVSDTIKQYQEHPLIDVWFGPPGPQWVGDELLVKIVETANRLGTSVQTHVLESFYEKEMGPRFYGESVISHLDKLGVLSPQFSMAHGVWVNETDIEILARTGASISHNPSSNLRLRAGIAPLPALLSGGVTVGLGMDGTTLNDDEDMFTEMRLAMRLARSPQIQDSVPTYSDIFKVATQGGAKLFGKADSIGKLAPGYKADIVLVDCECMSWPWVAPEVDPMTVVMMRSRQSYVDTVLINGKIVLKDAQPTGFDFSAVGEELAEQLKKTPDNTEYRVLAEAIRPYMVQWYSKWPIPELRPYTKTNSRR